MDLCKNTALDTETRMAGQLDRILHLLFDALAADVHPDLVIDRFKQYRYAAYDRRVDLLHIARDVAQTFAERHAAAAREREEEAACAFVDMVHRQYREKYLLGTDVCHLCDLAQVEADVALRKHDTLGCSRRAGREYEHAHGIGVDVGT